MIRREPVSKDESIGEHAQYRRSRGYWHRLFPLVSIVLLDIIFLNMLDQIFENSKDAIIRSEKNYFVRVLPQFSRIYDDYSNEVGTHKHTETAEEYQQRFIDCFQERADQYLRQKDFLYKITIIGFDGTVKFTRENLDKFRDLNTWRNCFISRKFSRTQKTNREIVPDDPDQSAQIIVMLHYTSPKGWLEIERLVLRFWFYALAFVLTTGIFYLWLDRRMIRPLARVARHLEQLGIKGTAQTVPQPRADIEAAYNRLVESQRGVRLEMELDRLIEGYQRGDEAPVDEMSVRLLLDTARAVGESFALQAVVVALPSSDEDEWESVSTWPGTGSLPPMPKPQKPVHAEPERFASNDPDQVWWTVPLCSEDEPLGILYILDGEEILPTRSVQHIQRLVENSLLRCASFSRRLAEERNRFGINLATSMGHDLTNIIAGGKWDLNTIHRALSRGAVQLEADKADVFNKAVEGLKNNLQFLQEMVDIYRALGAARAPRYERGDVGGYLKEVCDLFSLSTSQRLELVQDVSAACEAVVEPRLLKMALFNLLVNAAHAIQRRDDGLIGGRIEVCLYKEENDVVIVVCDDGPGIRDHDGKLLDDREVARIFGAGYSTKGSGAGGGLGLVWVKSIVEEFHQGTIRAWNRPESGAEIVLRFPCEDPDRTMAS
ncbi:MAG: HAMP domain-containing sensor histidine kinase [bacterium]